MEPKDIMTVEMVADYLNFSQEEVMSLIESRKIPCAEIGGKFLFVRKQILEWVASESSKRESAEDLEETED